MKSKNKFEMKYPNSLDLLGIPSYDLYVKIGSPIMMLKNGTHLNFIMGHVHSI